MSKIYKSFITLDLQAFAEGAGGEGGGSGDGASGVTEGASLPSTAKGAKNPLADVVYGKQPATASEDVEAASQQQSVEAPEDRQARFEAMIKGEFKDLYDARVSDTIQKRLKGTKETVDRYNELTPLRELLGKKYGVDPEDAKALSKAIEDDDSYFEDEALEKGMTVAQLKEIRKMERENAELKRQMQEQSARENAERLYASWMQQSESLAGVYPSFNLQGELTNPKFVDLLRNGIDVRTAYEVIHKDEIIPAAMQFTQQETMRKMANSIRSNGMRPQENGLSSASTAVVKSDPSQLSKADRAEINRRVAMGERIVF